MSEPLILYDIPVARAHPYRAVRDMPSMVIHQRLERLAQRSEGQRIYPSEILTMPAEDPEHPSTDILFNFGRLMQEAARINKPDITEAVKELITDALNLDLYAQGATFIIMARYHPASQNPYPLLRTDEDNRAMGYLTEQERETLADLHEHFAARFKELRRPQQKEIAGRFISGTNNEGVDFDRVMPYLGNGLRVLQSIVPDLVEDVDVRYLENIVATLDRKDFQVYPRRLETNRPSIL